MKVRATRPFDATVDACAYEGTAVAENLAPLSTCRPVFIDYGLRRLKVAIQSPDGERGLGRSSYRPCSLSPTRRRGWRSSWKTRGKADWLVRLDRGKVEFIEASGNRDPFPMPRLDEPDVGPVAAPEPGEGVPGPQPDQPGRPIREGAGSRQPLR